MARPVKPRSTRPLPPPYRRGRRFVAHLRPEEPHVTHSYETASGPRRRGRPCARRGGPGFGRAKPTLQCGQTVTHSVKLNADLTDCPDNGLVIGANDVTVDLNGHTIDGVPLRKRLRSPRGTLRRRQPRRLRQDGRRGRHDPAFRQRVAIGAGTVGTSDSRVHHLVVRDARFAGVDIGSGAGAAATARDRFDHNDISASPAARAWTSTPPRPTASTTTSLATRTRAS